jgi:hypothetical protein
MLTADLAGRAKISESKCGENPLTVINILNCSFMSTVEQPVSRNTEHTEYKEHDAHILELLEVNAHSQA